VISFGTFYKNFTNPIEVVLVNTGGLGQNFSYQNAPEAYSLGAELEARKSLSSLSVHKFFHNTTVNLNASWIKSEVDFEGVEGSEFQQSKKRAMQGQSPYVINAGIYYNDSESGFSANVGYNIFGKRITAVGSVVLHTWWELPRHSLDVQIAKMIGKFEVKLNVSNLLNAKYRTYQDDNTDNKIDKSIDQLMRGYQMGQHISLGVNWKLVKE
jgi:outer membrane receptor protein involved in Fe transport